MRILDRHVLREMATASAAATGGCVFVMVAGNVVRQIAGELVAGRVSLAQAVELVGLLIPGVVPYALPLGMLTGVLMAFGRLGSQQELTAMKAGGVSLVRTARPVFILAAILALACSWVNLEVAPRANTTYRALLTGAASDNPAAVITPGEFCRAFPNVVIRAGGRDGEQLTDLWIWQLDASGRLTQSIQAREARITRIPGAEGESDTVRIAAKDIRVERLQAKETARARPSTYVALGDANFEFPVARTEATGRRKLRWLTTTELFAAMETGWQLKPNATPEEVAIAKLEPLKQLNAHLASAFSVFSLTLLAVPLAVRVGRKETFVNAVVALGIALGFYVLSAMAAWADSPDVHPEWLIWLPNALVLVIALTLLRRASRH